MHGVATDLAEAAHGRLAGAHGANRFTLPFLTPQLHDAAETLDRAGDEVERGFVRDQLAALVIVSVRQQRRDRNLGEFWIAVELLAIGISELGTFDLKMDEFGACRIEAIELKAFQQRELLQHHRSLAPDAGFAYGVAVVIIRQ